MREILFDDGQGIRFVRERQAGMYIVTVQYRAPGAKRGSRLITYRFLAIPDAFESPYLSWRNLYCCGGWACDETILDTAVQEGTKLYAGRVQSLRDQYVPNAPTLEDARRKFAAFKASLPPGVYGDEETLRADDRYFHTYICREGSISDYFDLGKVFDHYHALGVDLEPARAEIGRLCSVEIKDYGTEKTPYPYFDTDTIPRLVTTGLLLGYPIESTASILLQ